MGRPAITLVLPAYNEAESIERAVREAAAAGEKAGTYEIVVVDDGSRDRSLAVIEARRRLEPRIRVVRHSANQGYGAALRAGLHEARGELVFFSDADLQFDLEELAILLSHTHEFDLVAGFRQPRRDPFPRIALAATWGALVRGLFGLRVRDIDCAFKVFHRRVLEAIPIASLGACVNTEILVRARQAGFRIHQVAVNHRRRRAGRQTGARPGVILRALFELAALRLELRRPGLSPRAPARESAS
jgi:glycosyltransferase involved in cell wall biosynthesis